MRIALVVVLLLAAALIIASFAVAQAPTANEARAGDDPRVPQDRLSGGALDPDARELPARPRGPLRARLPPAEPERAPGGAHHGAGGNDPGRPHLRRLLSRPVPLRRAQRHAGDRSQVWGGGAGGVRPREAGLRPGGHVLRAARGQSPESSLQPARARRAQAPLAGRQRLRARQPHAVARQPGQVRRDGGADPARRGPDVGAAVRAGLSVPLAGASSRGLSARGRLGDVGKRQGHELQPRRGS